MIRVVETYRDYEDPRALERQLQDWLADHPKDTWNESDYEHYYDLKDRINFAYQDEEYDMDIYDESYLRESTGSYTIVPIDSYEQFYKLYGGNLTGDGYSDDYAGNGGTAWAYANSKGVYDAWTKKGDKLYVLQSGDWKRLSFDEETNEEYKGKDDYGTSLICIRVSPDGRLLNSTLRCNHVGVRNGADNQYRSFSELSDVTGFDVEEEISNDMLDESYLREYYNQPLHDKLKRDGYTFVGSQGGWYCYAKNALGGGRPTYKAFPTNADSEDAIEDVSYEQVKGKDPMPYDIDTMDYYGRGNRGLSYRFAYESKLTESNFTGDPLLPDVKDLYEELIRMYDVRKDVGYVETVKKMLASIGGKANVNAFRSNTFGDDRMVIDWIVKDGEFKYTGRSYISNDSYGQWLMFIEDLCMAYYKKLGGKGGYTPDLIKAIGKGY